jgi:glycosyltransferase involved in cell wall biosynthesis
MTALTPLTNSSSPPGAPSKARKIRALHIIHSVCHGGIESAMLNWVRGLENFTDVEPYVACFAGDRGLEAAFLRAAETYGVRRVYQIPWTRRKPFLKAARVLAKLVDELEIDVVHTHAYYGDMLGAILKRYSKVKVVSTVYVWGKYELHRQIMQALDWLSLRFVDKVTAHCEETRRRTIALGFREGDVPLLIAGFPADVQPPSEERRRELRREAGIADDEIFMVNVARIHPEKAHDQLLRSFALVHKQHPKTKLWISGIGWQYLENELLSLRDSLGLQQVVQFVGHRSDLWPMLHAADMMVHASHVEGVPIAMLYGMAAGLPVVISDVGSIYEAIRQGDTGIRVPENDVEGFAREVQGLIEDPVRRKRIGRAARRFVEEEYSIEVAAKRVEVTYREVLAR